VLKVIGAKMRSLNPPKLWTLPELGTGPLARLTSSRFLQPILDEMKAGDPVRAQQIDTDLGLIYRSPQQ
jgi:hypothetical protein